MGNKTALYDAHVAANAKIVDFGGWDMPLHYGSQLEEHHYVRRSAGMFDVSHMTVVDLGGEEAMAFLRKLLANDVQRLKEDGKALYTGMLNEDGGVIDDLIVYRRDPGYRLVVNCATREKDLAWINRQAEAFDVTVKERPALAMIAVQGPDAMEHLAAVTGLGDSLLALKPFTALTKGEWMYCRTGYTGEDGLEVILPAADAETFWNKLMEAGVKPCGLGARDTLRLEAGLNLYGTDMEESISPLAANMGWTIAWQPEDRDFIGRSALEEERDTPHPELVGLVFRGKGVLRGHQKVVTPQGEGETTSGSYAPTLGCSVALARIPGLESGQPLPGEARVVMRGKEMPVEVVRPPFVRKGKVLV